MTCTYKYVHISITTQKSPYPRMCPALVWRLWRISQRQREYRFRLLLPRRCERTFSICFFISLLVCSFIPFPNLFYLSCFSLYLYWNPGGGWVEPQSPCCCGGKDKLLASTGKRTSLVLTRTRSHWPMRKYKRTSDKLKAVPYTGDWTIIEMTSLQLLCGACTVQRTIHLASNCGYCRSTHCYLLVTRLSDRCVVEWLKSCID
jgi:hypothetical protein